MNNETDNKRLENLLQAYRAAPEEFQATSYWEAYEEEILATIEALDPDKMRSGRYKILSTFGFNDTVYSWQGKSSAIGRAALGMFTVMLSNIRDIAPYKVRVTDIRELAYRHCELMGELAGAKPIDSIEVSTFGGPSDLFEIAGKKYSMPFLNFYLRYCFAQRVISMAGDECIVELGSGSKSTIPWNRPATYTLPAKSVVTSRAPSRADPPHASVARACEAGLLR